MVEESVGVVKFYSENKDANQYQADIEELVAKGIDRSKAFRFVLAEKDPSLLLDDAKRAQLNGNTALN
jgi:predicted secreted acid phosphatase